MDDSYYGMADQQARDMENFRRQAINEAVKQKVEKLGIAPELAEYLVDLEMRIANLEKNK